MARAAGRRLREMFAHRFHLAVTLAFAFILPLFVPASVSAQVVPPIPQIGGIGGQTNPEDTVTVPPFRYDPPVSPLGAMFRSMLVPGWGQSVLNRRITGAVFIVWEGITLGMTVKSKHQLGYMERAQHEAIEAKRAEYEDWLVLLVFNHLMAGAEAFVGANLWDFPDEIRFARFPNGGYGILGSIPLRR